MKLLLDFLPLALFFAMFKSAEAQREWAAAFATTHLGFMVQGGVIGPAEAPVLLATVVVMAATLAQVVLLKLLRQKVDAILWVSLGLVIVLGLATVYFHSETFIKWKPTALYWAVSLGFLGALAFGRHPLKAVFKDVELPEAIWRKLAQLWIGFFAAMGGLNLWVAYSFPTATWANFKVFGATALLLLFTLGQGVYLMRHLPEAQK